MGGFPKINIVYSTSQWLFPTITIWILIIIGVILLASGVWKRKKEGKPIFVKKRFFYRKLR